MESKYLQLKDAAPMCGMKLGQMRVLCLQGVIPAKKVGGMWYVSRDTIDRTFGGESNVSSTGTGRRNWKRGACERYE